ncbi:unnamed protein product [Taenia asiatica]|uniref:Serine/threonine-protein kinase Chk2 n=1 Tax=Taenia asiatica TaxID=60517 RepID=A0A0R3VXU3_TAEAS|nr:unnamed protein product [Taenia asiatica]
MSDLPPTQEVGDVSTLDGNSQAISQIWGGLFPLKRNIPPLPMSKESYTVGREGSCDIVLTSEMFTHGPLLSAVSKVHFRIARVNTNVSPQVFIYDLSTNGTFVNGQKIGKGRMQPLCNNDEISIATQNCKCFLFTDTLSSEYPDEVSSKYTICRSLGRGACGEVRIAYARETCVQYAIKIVPKRTFSSHRSRFGNRELTEVEILKKLNYPCIVKIHDVIETEETLFIVLELVEGGELFDRILSSGHLSEDDSKFFFLQILMATKYLHDNGITHRDLKPENILLTGNSNRCLIKITDFGLSKIVNDNTMLRTFCGTPTYLAPEVLLTAGNGTYTPSIDVWSLGVILYVCLVGYPPFTDERKDCDLKTQITNGLYDFPDIYWKGVSESAKDLVRRLMCVNPTERITLEEALLHPWLSDQAIRDQLADLMKTAGFLDLVDGALDPRNLTSCMRCNRSLTPVKLDGDANGTDGGESNDTVSTLGNSPATRKRSIEAMADESCQSQPKKSAF